MKDCIDLIVTQAEKNPDNPCVVENTDIITYGQFMKDVRKIAGFLKENNYNKVLLSMGQGGQAYRVIIAVLFAGGYYCPLNQDSPEGRKLYVTKEFQPDVIISSSKYKLPSDKIGNVPQVTTEEILMGSADDPVDTLRNQQPNELSYIIYTSGSTGNPKGVMIKRNSLNKFLEWSISAFKCCSNDRWAQYSSLSFDLSVVDIFTSLCSGAALVPMPEMGHKMRPANTVVKHCTTVWHSVPGAIDFMIQQEQTRPADLSSLRRQGGAI